jgi:hypothetical protein
MFQRKQAVLTKIPNEGPGEEADFPFSHRPGQESGHVVRNAG